MNEFYINGEEVSKAAAVAYVAKAVQRTVAYYGEGTENAAMAIRVSDLRIGSKHLSDEQLEELGNVTGILEDGALEVVRDWE